MPTLHRIHRPAADHREELGRVSGRAGSTPSRCTPTRTSSRSARPSRQLFGVKVTGVWTMQMRRQGRRAGQASGAPPHWKKAIVTLKDGDTIADLRGLSMSIRQFKPVTAGTRFRSVSGFAEITRDTPEKSLLEPIKKSGGRDNHGHITMRGIGAAGTSGSTASSTSSANKFGDARHGRGDRVRSEPLARASRSSCTRTARSATSCTPRG